MSAPFVSPLLQRTLSAVYRFYDAFFFPPDLNTPQVASPLDVSIPSRRWSALRAESDNTYRFSAPTLTVPPPAGANLVVQVTALTGDYLSLEPIKLSLPLPLSSPPVPSDFLQNTPLWPTPSLRPPDGETAVRGQVKGATAQPVAGLKVEMWTGASPTPPPGTPYNLTDVQGQFVYRLPLLKGAAGSLVTFKIRLNSGAITLSPASVSLVLGVTQIILFQRL
jgi:hypothetical protein